MTVDCFKSMCMMSTTAEGRKVQKYYILLSNIIQSYIKLKCKRTKTKSEEELMRETRLKAVSVISKIFDDNNMTTDEDRQLFAKTRLDCTQQI